jgi:acetyl-CoA carboxylase alpha subunit
MENRNGLVADVETMQADGTAERDAAVVMIASIPGNDAITIGADKGYDTKGFVADARAFQATPHVAQKKHSAVDGRTPYKR